MNVQFYFSNGFGSNFANACQAVIRNVGQGTKKATMVACQEIMNDSVEQCPVDTGALVSTAWWDVQQRGDVKGYRYEGIMGYASDEGVGLNAETAGRTLQGGQSVSSNISVAGDDSNAVVKFGGRSKPMRVVGKDAYRTYGFPKLAGGANNVLNPKTGKPVRWYAARVHEDLKMPHAPGKKAKFLEDPVRAYGSSKFKQVAASYWKQAIQYETFRVTSADRGSAFMDARRGVERYKKRKYKTVRNVRVW